MSDVSFCLHLFDSSLPLSPFHLCLSLCCFSDFFCSFCCHFYPLLKNSSGCEVINPTLFVQMSAIFCICVCWLLHPPTTIWWTHIHTYRHSLMSCALRLLVHSEVVGKFKWLMIASVVFLLLLLSLHAYCIGCGVSCLKNKSSSVHLPPITCLQPHDFCDAQNSDVG